MNVHFRTLNIKGFMSLVDETIDLENLGVVLVKGINNYDPLFKSNGSGKSAIFDSILWVLTGYTSRGSKNIINRNLNTGTCVTLTINIDNDEYVIERTDGYLDKKKSVTIIKNGEDISGSTLTKSKEVLESQLGFITYDVLTSIIILSQGLPSRLSSLRPSDRKSRLEYLSNTDGILEEIKNKMSLAHSDIITKSSSINTERTKTSTSISANQSTIESCNRKINEINDYNERNSGLNQETVDSYNSQIDQYKTSLEVMRDKYSKILKLESELSNNKFRVTNRISELGRKIRDLTSQYLSLSSNICPMCKSVLDSPDELKTHLSNEILTYKKEYVSLNEELKSLESRTVPDSSNYTKLINEYSDKLNELTRIIDEYNRMQSSVSSYETTKKECEDKIKDLNKQLLRIESESKEIDKELEIYNFFNSAVSRKFRNFLLDGVISYLNTRLSYYSKYLFSNGQSVYLENNGNNIDIKLGESYFEDLSGGEGRRVDIILQLAQRDLSRTESGFSCNLLVLDEILDYLDSDGIISVLQMLEKESSSVDTLMIVTHRDELDVPNDSELIVIKDQNQLSRVSR